MKKRSIWFCFVGAFACWCGCEPDFGASDLEKGDNAFRLGDLKGAVVAYEAAAAACPTSSVPSLRLAAVKIRLGDVGGARAAAQDALARDPDSAEGRLALAQAAYLAHDARRALELQAEVASCGDLPDGVRSRALSDRGVVLLSENRFDEALLSFFRAKRLDPGNAAAWYHMGVMARDTLRNDAAALVDFKMFARLTPAGDGRQDDVLRNVIPAIERSQTICARNRAGSDRRNPADCAAALAKKDFAKAYELDPYSHPAALGWAKQLAGRAKTPAECENALRIFRNAIEAEPASRETHLAAARFARTHRQTATAERILMNALAYFPEDRVILDDLVQVLKDNNKVSQAELYRGYRREL